MPDILLPVPHFEQSDDGACLPACLRMVLAYWGQHLTEKTVGQQIGTEEFGTPLFYARRLNWPGYQVWVGSLSEAQLKQHLQNKQPVIARVWTEMLDYWDVETSHVVVIVGYDDEFVYFNDPAFAQTRRPVLWDAFLASWAEYDESAVLVYQG